MKTIVFRATFEESTKTSAIIGEDQDLYQLLQEQCKQLFGDQSFDVKVNGPLGKKLETSQDILESVKGLQFSILNVFLSRAEVTPKNESESQNTVTAVAEEDIEEQTPDCSATNLKEKKKQERIAQRLQKQKERMERIAKRQLEVKAKREAKLVAETKGAEQAVEKKVKSALLVERKEKKELTLADIEVREQMLMAKLKKLREEKQALKRRAQIEKQEERKLARQKRQDWLKTLEANYSPEIIKRVYIDKEQMLSPKPFKKLNKNGDIEKVLTSMNSAFALKMQSIDPEHKLIYGGPNSESDVNLVETANKMKDGSELDSSLFVCSGCEFKELKKLGANVIRPQKWVKVVTANLLPQKAV